MKKIVKRLLIAVLAVLIICAAVFTGIYFTRLRTIASIEKITDYEDGYDLYRMDVKYDYDLDRIIDSNITTDQEMINAMVAEGLPLLPVTFKAPNFGCSSFTIQYENGEVHMGRNYDFKTNTSAMLVHTSPKNGYESVAFAALSNLKANEPLDSVKGKMATLLAPYVCLDGVNEKGVSISVLTLDSEPVYHDTGKKKITTSLAIRLVLDRAATTEEAVKLLQSYDMFATSGRDYHFYITDASGDGRAIEFDCDDEKRELTATPVNAVTNFFALYEDKVQPGERNRYGHGKDRYEAIQKVLSDQKGNYTEETAWDALKAAAQNPDPKELTSNTQWSIVYDNSDPSAKVVLRRHWNDIYNYDLADNSLQKE